MIQNVNLGTKTNFQGGRNIKIIGGKMLEEPMSKEGARATLTGLLTEAKEFKRIGTGNLGTTEDLAKGITIHTSEAGDSAVFRHITTGEVLSYDPIKMETHVIPNQGSNNAAVLTPDKETLPLLVKLGTSLGVIK